ncbi:MAG TPA: sigma-54 dependent transcriptional regulator [Pyrinomonadaceae bacterium]|nr:sigma-54 dependent transcriptional regulator [Pyrinomonadaceae bacterium]
MKNSLCALVVDDEPQVSRFVAEVLRTDGWQVSEVHTAEQAFEMLEQKNWSLVFCDVSLGETNGYAVLRYFSEHQSEARFVLMTGHGSAAGALDATAGGAYDYLVKPFTVNDLLSISKNVREQIQVHNKPGKPDLESSSFRYKSDIPLIGKSPKFVECLKLVGRVAPTNLPVLITGESGTGKEVVARAIHQRSTRAAGNFVTVNCGAIPTELIESELFGHAKGSFTGADRERLGLWEEATGGTLFLDEITETNQFFQVKLLRALQEGEIRRVGSNRTIKVDVRVIAATNRDIEKEVREGRFRRDLMYRLNAVTIQLPPLRERLEDIPLIAEHFAKQIRPPGAMPLKFSDDTLEMLKNYNWQGNIRELENAVLHAVSLSDDVVYPEHLPSHFAELPKTESDEKMNAPDILTQNQGDKLSSLAEMEEKYVTQVLSHTGGNKQAAARILNIDRKTLVRIINRAQSKS